MDSLLRASGWDGRWTPPMTKPKERNILLLLRTVANAFQGGVKFENIVWALKVLVLLIMRWELRIIPSNVLPFCKQIFKEPLPNDLFTSPQKIVGSTLLLKCVNSPLLFYARNDLEP